MWAVDWCLLQRFHPFPHRLLQTGCRNEEYYDPDQDLPLETLRIFRRSENFTRFTKDCSIMSRLCPPELPEWENPEMEVCC
jgi:hypothetical protein